MDDQVCYIDWCLPEYVKWIEKIGGPYPGFFFDMESKEEKAKILADPKTVNYPIRQQLSLRSMMKISNRCLPEYYCIQDFQKYIRFKSFGKRLRYNFFPYKHKFTFSIPIPISKYMGHPSYPSGGVYLDGEDWSKIRNIIVKLTNTIGNDFYFESFSYRDHISGSSWHLCFMFKDKSLINLAKLISGETQC